MKHIPLLCAALGLLTLPAPAAPAFPDVPPGHWAAASVRRIAAAGVMTAAPDGRFHGDRPVTRYELAVVLDRLVRDIEAARKPLSATAPRPVTLPPATPPAPAAALTHLLGNGFLPAATPLLARPGTQPVTAQQLADALAQVTIRLSDRSLPPQKD